MTLRHARRGTEPNCIGERGRRSGDGRRRWPTERPTATADGTGTATADGTGTATADGGRACAFLSAAMSDLKIAPVSGCHIADAPVHPVRFVGSKVHACIRSHADGRCTQRRGFYRRTEATPVVEPVADGGRVCQRYCEYFGVPAVL
jgi:hypothetical protein